MERGIAEFFGLCVINIIFAALTMAFAMSAAILGILGLVGAGDGLLSSLVSLLLGGAAFISASGG